MSNKLVKNNEVNGFTTKEAEAYASVISRVVSDLRVKKSSKVTLNTGEIMVFILLDYGVSATVIPLFVDAKTAERRLALIRDNVSKRLGFTNATYTKRYVG